MRSLIISLQRTGVWKRPTYNIVVTHSQRSVRGANFEKIGFYSTSFYNNCFFVSLYRLAYWLLRGAYVTPSVGFLLGKLLANRRALASSQEKI